MAVPSNRPMCLKQHTRQMRTFRALIGYQPGLLSDRRDCNHLVHRGAASWAVSPVVSARSASVRHDTRPLRWGSMSHIPPPEVTRDATVGCRWGAKQSCPRWSTVRGPSPLHPAQGVANRHGLATERLALWRSASIAGLAMARSDVALALNSRRRTSSIGRPIAVAVGGHGTPYSLAENPR
jgi:hypothetical protein